MTDTKKLSKNALKIFKKLKPYYPPDPWKNPSWKEDGTVRYASSGAWLDLKKASDRKALEDSLKSSIGYGVYIDALIYKDKHKQVPNGRAGWLKNFTSERFTKVIQHTVEQLIILNDLDFQIETQDIIDGYDG